MRTKEKFAGKIDSEPVAKQETITTFRNSFLFIAEAFYLL